MKITSTVLEQLKAALLTKSTAFDTASKAAKAATDQRDQIAAEVRGLQASFDVCASSFAQDSELSKSQCDALPAAAQQIVGYAPGKPAAPKA